MSEVGVEYRELATSCLINQKLMHLSRTGHVEREKFKISLAEYLRKGLAPRDYATYRPKNLLPDTTSNNGDPEHELTPQQKARKRYEERNKEARLEKARERMAKRRASDPKGDRDRQKRYEEQYRRTHREDIVKNVVTARIVVDRSCSTAVILKSGVRGHSPTTVNVGTDVFNDLKTMLLKSYYAT
ncbi:hypothetical protein C8R42DRAFT_644609 [Lentinula raphanica]|nr:hypothetical protein C8R42DRAFT_649381 [Lentinula raphanica]KAJ3717354.1 hypothetical protein C8R42DRAFT_644609 [Lentinula raphanica]